MQRLRLSPALARTASALTLAACFVSATSAAAQETRCQARDRDHRHRRARVARSLDRSQAQLVGRRRRDFGRGHRQVPRHQPRRIAPAHHRRVDRPRQRRRLAGHRARLRPRLQPRHAQRPRDADREHRLGRPGPERRLRLGHHPLVRLLEHRLRRRQPARGLQDRARIGDLGRHRRGDQHRHPPAARRRGRVHRLDRRQGGLRPVRHRLRPRHAGSLRPAQLGQRSQHLRHRPVRQLPAAQQLGAVGHGQRLEHRDLRPVLRPEPRPGQRDDDVSPTRRSADHAGRRSRTTSACTTPSSSASASTGS